MQYIHSCWFTVTETTVKAGHGKNRKKSPKEISGVISTKGQHSVHEGWGEVNINTLS